MVFFFKQKTAYEMRISDWSSDVCSSDLHLGACALLKEKAPVRKTTKRTKKGSPSRVALGIGGGGGNRTRARTHSIPGTTCLAHRWISIGRANVCTPVTNAYLVCRLLLGLNNANQTSIPPLCRRFTA